MSNKLEVLSKYRLEKAREDLKSAKINLENGLIKASINRSYYCIFHAIRSVNALNEFDSKRHSGVIAYFNKNFIHTGIFEKNVYTLISAAYRIREKSDYDDFYIASKISAEEQYNNACYFINLVEGYLVKRFKEMP